MEGFEHFFKEALKHLNKEAIRDPSGSYSYASLLQDSFSLSSLALSTFPSLSPSSSPSPSPPSPPSVAFLFPRSYSYVATLYAIWRMKGQAVPLCEAHPERELTYAVQDSKAVLLIFHPSYEELAKKVAGNASIPFMRVDPQSLGGEPPLDHPSLSPPSPLGFFSSLLFSSLLFSSLLFSPLLFSPLLSSSLLSSSLLSSLFSSLPSLLLFFLLLFFSCLSMILFASLLLELLYPSPFSLLFSLLSSSLFSLLPSPSLPPPPLLSLNLLITTCINPHRQFPKGFVLLPLPYFFLCHCDSVEDS